MTNEQLKKALLNKQLVRYTPYTEQPTEYYITAVIYKCGNGRVLICAELKDKQSNSVMVVPARNVEEIENENSK